MKQIKMSQVLLMVFLLTSLTMVASTLTVIQEVADGKVNFVNLAIEFAKYVFLGMLITAINHIVAGTFNLKLWLKDTLLPAVLAYGGGLAIAALDIYLPQWDFFVEAAIGGVTDHTDFTNLAVTGVVLVAIIKGLFKINDTREKNAVRKAKLNK